LERFPQGDLDANPWHAQQLMEVVRDNQMLPLIINLDDQKPAMAG
jgi:hypothetical protein